MGRFNKDEDLIEEAFNVASPALDEHKIKLIMELFNSLGDNEMKRAVFYLLDKWAIETKFRTNNKKQNERI